MGNFKPNVNDQIHAVTFAKHGIGQIPFWGSKNKLFVFS
jgi:hypothetical protein